MAEGIDINAELIKALIRVLEEERPGLRQALCEKLADAASRHDGNGNATAAAELRAMAEAPFLSIHR